MKNTEEHIRATAEYKVAFTMLVGDFLVTPAILFLPIITVYLRYCFSVKMLAIWFLYLVIVYILFRFASRALYWSSWGYDAKVELKAQEIIYTVAQKKKLLAQDGALSPSNDTEGSLSIAEEGRFSLHTKDPA